MEPSKSEGSYTCDKSQISQSGLSQDELERLNRARDFFGDAHQRFKDRLIVERCSKVEEYRRGRAALILQLNFPSLCAVQPESMRVRQGVDAVPVDSAAFVVLKADLLKLHPLKDWDQKLMFVPIVQVMEKREPEIPIPIASRVGFYGIQNEPVERRTDLILFKSLIKSGYKFFPSFADWESGPIPRAIGRVEKIEGTPQIMKRVADYQSTTITLKLREIHVESEEIGSIRVLLDADRVEARIEKIGEQHVDIEDVLIGPFNL